MNKRGLIGVIVLVIIVLFIGFFIFITKYNSNNDFECPGKGCIKVQTTCCPCSMGGEEKCLKESEAEKYSKELENCSEGIICPAVYNCNIISCNETGAEK